MRELKYLLGLAAVISSPSAVFVAIVICTVVILIAYVIPGEYVEDTVP
jgi:hypothetical protein